MTNYTLITHPSLFTILGESKEKIIDITNYTIRMQILVNGMI